MIGSAKVDVWVKSVEKLSAVAQQEPQSAYIAFTKSLQMDFHSKSDA